ncbi:helix-turn-helix domain-containing protein [Chryseobacterium sp. CBSDS_008]|uniref:helix-turn-helix domain-containing protein n=1 Tax=Chryseobacterium sp. CBSDS_008 TaxID=3415265 RepID=UPI003CF3C443
MNRPNIHFLAIVLIFLCEMMFAQQDKLSDFYIIQRQYENLPENDSAALPLVERLIRKAKHENNQMQLFLGYKDARYYSRDPEIKLKYADSAISIAKLKKNDSLLSSAYLSKGVVYYFYLKKYKLALNEYLRAFEKNKSNKDPYYRNKINYHIGVLKSYIGYYDEALLDFEEAREFFEGEIQKNLHPNVMFGNQRGYLNTVHQMAVCYRKLRKFQKADSLISLGLSRTWKNPVYKQEYSYFLKEEGIRKFREKDYANAAEALRSSLPGIIDIDDFAWLTVSYFYLGRSNWKEGNTSEAIKYFNKIDSIFTKHNFVLPEVRYMYEDLINYYGDNNPAKTLYYTGQLIKVDRVLDKDFVYLSSKIHKKYDAENLLRKQEELQRKSWMKVGVYLVGFFLILIGVFYLLLRFRSRKSVIGQNSILGINLAGGTLNTSEEGAFRVRTYKRTGIGDDIVEDILHKLEEFEANMEFLDETVKIKSLAKKFGVNQNYLSEIIQEHRGANFHLYLCELRISYITQKLLTDDEYLKYSSSTLAKECGISSRTNFSKVFAQINGINFTQFVNNRKRELKGAPA